MIFLKNDQVVYLVICTLNIPSLDAHLYERLKHDRAKNILGTVYNVDIFDIYIWNQIWKY